MARKRGRGSGVSVAQQKLADYRLASSIYDSILEERREGRAERFAMQKWEAEEERRRGVAAAQIEQAEKGQTLQVWDRFTKLWEKAGNDPAFGAHYTEMMKSFVGTLSPKNQEMLEPFMAEGPLSQNAVKEEFFDRKNPRIPRPERREGETDQDYNNRLAPWAKGEYRRDWQKKRFLFGAEAVGSAQEIIPYGEDENRNLIFLRMTKGEPATFETRASAEFTSIEESGGHFKKKMAKNSLRNNKGIEEGPTTYASAGNREYSYTQTYNWLTGKKDVDRVDIGPKQLRRGDLTKTVADPPPGFEEFQLNLIGGKKSGDVEGSTEGGRIYSMAFDWRYAQLQFRKKEQSIEELDYNFGKMLESLWPGYTVRYKYNKGTAQWRHWYEEGADNIFGDNARIEPVPGIYVGVRHPKFDEKGNKGEGKWVRAIYDSTNQVIYGLNPEKDRYEPAMSEMEYLNMWNGEGPIPIEEFEEWEGKQEE